jgi:hypothetical protein
MSPPPIPLGPEVAQKLEAARRRLVAVNLEIGEIVAQPGSNDKRLAALRRDRDEARNVVDELEAAHAAALRKDAEAEAAHQVAAREQQFAAFKAVAEEWAQAGTELASALEKAAKLRVELGRLTEKMQQAFPTGVVPYAVDFKMVDIMVTGVAMPVALDIVLAGAMFKHGLPNAFLPGARAPIASMAYDQPAIEPAAAAFKRSGAHYVRLLRDRFDSMESKTAEAA